MPLFSALADGEYFGSLLIFAGLSFAMMSLSLNILNSKYSNEEGRKNLLLRDNDGRDVGLDIKVRGMSRYVEKNFVSFSLVTVSFMIGAFIDLFYLAIGDITIGIFAFLWISITTILSISVVLLTLKSFDESQQI